MTAMMDLAIHQRIGPVTLADISAQQGISLSYLEQLFALLRGQGLVEGQRGPGGGYRLARPADQISIAEIILAVDDRRRRNASADGPDDGQRRRITDRLWDDLSHRIEGFLDRLTLADFVERAEVQEFLEREQADRRSVARRKKPAA